jgi:hypothetical protein
MFKPATRKQLRGRIALCGPTGSGKTFTALRLAAAMGARIAVIDSERKSASKYVGQTNPDGGVFAFDVCELESYHPETYVGAIKAADEAGYDVLVIDSLTHAWSGKDGALEQVDKAKSRSSNNGNSFTAWRDVTPMHNNLVDSILDSKAHVIATMRSKMEYILEEDARGKKIPRKVGMAPIQREGMEYEFDVVGDVDIDHRLVVTKSRCPDVADAVIMKPGRDLAAQLLLWLNTGASPAEVARIANANDPSWEDGGQEEFFAALAGGGVTLTYDEIAKMFAKSKKPEPAKVDRETRGKMAAFLIDKFGTEAKAKQEAYLADQAKKAAEAHADNGNGV